mgnify:FL=1
MTKISIVVPAKDEAESLPELLRWIGQVMATHQYSYEVILIDDGSTDDTWHTIERLAAPGSGIREIGRAHV